MVSYLTEIAGTLLGTIITFIKFSAVIQFRDLLIDRSILKAGERWNPAFLLHSIIVETS